MHWNNPEGIKALTIELVQVPSISRSNREVEAADVIYKRLGTLEYFKNNPEHLKKVPIPEDPYGRSFIFALVKGKQAPANTVMLMGHYDVVDVEEYGHLKPCAFDPEALRLKLNPAALPEDARADLLSGEWLFGRGIADMKCGLAMEMALLSEYAESPDKLNGNIIFVAVPDEESNSAGMVAAVPELNRLAGEFGLDYTVVVDCEPFLPRWDGDRNFYIYSGSIGKMLPVFLFIGKETHVGEPLLGLGAGLLASAVNYRIEINTELCDEVEGEVAPPPTCLKLKDMKELYSAQLPYSAVSYYNVLSMKKTPGEVLEKLKQIAREAFADVLGRLKAARTDFSRRSGLKTIPSQWEPKVYTYSEIFEMVKNAHGKEFTKHMDDYMKKLSRDPDVDEREFGIKVMMEVHNYCPDRDPKIVIAFLPPYYPYVGLRGETEKEKQLVRGISALIAEAEKAYGVKLVEQKYFPGISDLSYVALQDAGSVEQHLVPNMPTWGYRYSLPVLEMAKMNLPVLIFGPWGKDIHKYTERLHMKYSFETAPGLLKFFAETMLKP